MSTHKELADWQTDNVIVWAMNDEPTYNAYIDRIEKRGKFTAGGARVFVRNLWRDRAPDGSGLSRVRWGQVARVFNDDIAPCLRIGSIKRQNAAAGFYFFSAGAMGFFNSTVYPNTRAAVDGAGVTHGTMFVTSEYCDWGCISVLDVVKAMENRRYTVRLFDHSTKQINTVGEFGKFDTLDRALSFMRGWVFNQEEVS